MRNATVQLVWLIVEVAAIVRSSIATFNVVNSISNGDTLFSVFTVGVVELALFGMLVMAGSEPIAPVAALVLIAFSGVMQYAELLLLTGSMDQQSKTMLLYAASFAPSVLLLFGLVKRLTGGESNPFAGVGDAVRGLFGGDDEGERSYADEVESVPFVRKQKRRGSKSAK